MYRDSRECLRQFDERMQQSNRKSNSLQLPVGAGQLFRSRASSWDLDHITNVLDNDDVRRVQTHIWQFGMAATTGNNSWL